VKNRIHNVAPMEPAPCVKQQAALTLSWNQAVPRISAEIAPTLPQTLATVSDYRTPAHETTGWVPFRATVTQVPPWRPRRMVVASFLWLPGPATGRGPSLRFGAESKREPLIYIVDAGAVALASSTGVNSFDRPKRPGSGPRRARPGRPGVSPRPWAGPLPTETSRRALVRRGAR